MFSSRLYPLYVRAVSLQTCDRAFELLGVHRAFQTVFGVGQGRFLVLADHLELSNYDSEALVVRFTTQ
ncbi:hypothetical protein ACFVS2_31795 [Brevibacillus sp. NPDC058079]|uniref:hypothetical protein n=1 Tax=Brevibacillus sp. NPDC058079 TaxID=3346330 RepID=UPI0036ED8BF0